MAKQYRVRDRLLLGLALLGDALDETVGKSSYAYRRGSLNFWAPPGYKEANYTATVWRMLRTGHAERVIKKGKPYLRLTNQGKKKLVRDFSFLRFQQKPWDRKWRVVIFDISEKHRKVRDYLRYKLKDLGFGRLQKSVYISPFDIAEDIAEFLEGQRLSGWALVLVTEHEFMGNPRDLAEKIWKLKKINREYKALLKKAKAVAQIRKTVDLKQALRDLNFSYLNILLKDPFLPRELLPETWLGDKARREVLNLNSRS